MKANLLTFGFQHLDVLLDSGNAITRLNMNSACQE